MELETFFTVQEQTRLFFLSCVAGMLLGIVYDGLRVLRAVVPHRRWSVSLEDALFVIVWSVQLMGFVSLFARGELRAYYAVGNLLGFVLQRLTIGNLVVGAVRRISGTLRKGLRWLWRPVAALQMRLCRKICSKFVRIKQKHKIRQKN